MTEWSVRIEFRDTSGNQTNVMNITRVSTNIDDQHDNTTYECTFPMIQDVFAHQICLGATAGTTAPCIAGLCTATQHSSGRSAKRGRSAVAGGSAGGSSGGSAGGSTDGLGARPGAEARPYVPIDVSCAHFIVPCIGTATLFLIRTGTILLTLHTGYTLPTPHVHQRGATASAISHCLMPNSYTHIQQTCGRGSVAAAQISANPECSVYAANSDDAVRMSWLSWVRIRFSRVVMCESLRAPAPALALASDLALAPTSDLALGPASALAPDLAPDLAPGPAPASAAGPMPVPERHGCGVAQGPGQHGPAHMAVVRNERCDFVYAPTALTLVLKTEFIDYLAEMADPTP